MARKDLHKMQKVEKRETWKTKIFVAIDKCGTEDYNKTCKGH